MLKTLIVLLISCFSLVPQAYAGKWNLGLKIAYVEPDESLIETSDNADNAGVVVGCDWLTDYGVFGIEADYTTSFLEGSVNKAGVSIDEAFFIDTFGIYGTYKTSIDSSKFGFYGKIKAGGSYYKITSSNFLDEDEFEFSFGGGVGMFFGSVAIEFGYTVIKDFNMLSLSVLF